MIDHRTDGETEAPAAAAPISADSFVAVAVLVALIADPKGCGARLKALQDRQAAAMKAEANLATARAEYDGLMTKQRAELEEEKKALVAKAVRLHAQEGALEAEQQSLRERYPNRRRVEVFSGGMTRELPADFSDETPVDDAHYRQVIDPYFVPSSGATLTREPEQIQRKRTMRRGQDG